MTTLNANKSSAPSKPISSTPVLISGMSIINAFSKKETCLALISSEFRGSSMKKLLKRKSTPILTQLGKCATLTSKTNGSETLKDLLKSTKKLSDNNTTLKSYIFILFQWIVSGTLSGAVPITGTKKWF